jgi:hypothetical protein
MFIMPSIQIKHDSKFFETFHPNFPLLYIVLRVHVPEYGFARIGRDAGGDSPGNVSQPIPDAFDEPIMKGGIRGWQSIGMAIDHSITEHLQPEFRNIGSCELPSDVLRSGFE